jgi:hypothetical protein
MDYLGRFISFLGGAGALRAISCSSPSHRAQLRAQTRNCVYLRKDHSDGCGELPLDLCLVWGFDVRLSDSASPFSRNRFSHL